MIYKYKDTDTGKIIESVVEIKKLKPSVIRVQSAPGDKKLLVLRRALGDVLMLFPTLEMWWRQKKRPNITFGTDRWLMALAQRQEFITDVVDYKTVDKEQFEQVYWLEGEIDFLPIEYRKHRSLLFADMLYKLWSAYDKQTYTYDPEEIQLNDYFHLSTTEKRKAKDMLRKNGWKGKKKLIALAPATKSDLREWQNEFTLVRWMQEYDFVMLHDKKIVVSREFDNLINLSGNTNLFQMASILTHCDAAVLPDSGIMHAAGVIGTPTVSIFGRVIPSENRVTYYDNVHPIESSCPLTEGHCYDGQFVSCHNSKNFRKCMKRITVGEIGEELQKLLEGEK